MRKPQLVSNWKSLWKAASVQILAAGALLPEILQVIANNTELLPWLDTGAKDGIRLAAIVVAILVRPIKQTSVSGPPKE